MLYIYMCYLDNKYMLYRYIYIKTIYIYIYIYIHIFCIYIYILYIYPPPSSCQLQPASQAHCLSQVGWETCVQHLLAVCGGLEGDRLPMKNPPWLRKIWWSAGCDFWWYIYDILGILWVSAPKKSMIKLAWSKNEVFASTRWQFEWQQPWSTISFWLFQNFIVEIFGWYPEMALHRLWQHVPRILQMAGFPHLCNLPQGNNEADFAYDYSKLGTDSTLVLGTC